MVLRGDRRGVRGYVVLYLLWLAFTLCYGYGLVQADLAARLHRGTVVVLDAGLGREDGKGISDLEAEEDAPMDFALWRETPGGIFADSEGRSRLPAAVVDCFGSTRLACQDGSAPELLFEDGEGCLLSADLARELFGSENVVGQTLFCRNRQMVIRGILRRGRGQIVLQAGEEFAETMDRLTVGGTGSRADAFLLRHGLSGQKLSLDYASLAAKLAAWILLLFVGLYPLYGAYRLSKECPAVLCAAERGGYPAPDSRETEWPVVMEEKAAVSYPRSRAFIHRICILAAACLYLCLLIPSMGWGGSFSVNELLPTKWSDFAFWSRKGQEVAASIGFLFGSEKTEGEQMVLWTAAVGIFFLFLAFLFYWRTARRLAGVSVYTLAALIFFHWAGLAVLAVRCGEISAVLAAHRSLWLAAPFGIAAVWQRGRASDCVSRNP
ncbi:MAG TPA: hypothetical protein DF613_12785 [Lachnospiraceae bacterium]|nr:hypothetical protein [Lachnospiraceae bacterium]